MTEEKVKQSFDLINGLSYQEWTILSREIEKFFKTIQQESVLNLSEKGKDFAIFTTRECQSFNKHIGTKFPAYIRRFYKSSIIQKL